MNHGGFNPSDKMATIFHTTFSMHFFHENIWISNFMCSIDNKPILVKIMAWCGPFLFGSSHTTNWLIHLAYHYVCWLHVLNTWWQRRWKHSTPHNNPHPHTLNPFSTSDKWTATTTPEKNILNYVLLPHVSTTSWYK